MLLQAVTNGNIQTPLCAQVYPHAAASCYKWPDTASTLYTMYIHKLLQGVTNGQIQTPHCTQGISTCCCKRLQMARYCLHIVHNVYPRAVASCYKWPDTVSTLYTMYIHVLLQAVTNGQILPPHCTQCISTCCCKLLQMARYCLHIVHKVYPRAVASCYKWPDTASTLYTMYIHVLLQAVTNGQILPPHCTQCISISCCKLLQMARYCLHIVHNVYPRAVARGYKWPDTASTLYTMYIHKLLQAVTNGQILPPHCTQCISISCCKLLQMARYCLHIVHNVYPRAVASCYKWPDTASTLYTMYIHKLLQAVTNGQILPPHCTQCISTCCCKRLQMARYCLHIVHNVYP